MVELRALILTCFAAAMIHPQAVPQTAPAEPARAGMAQGPRRSCAELRGLTGYEFSIATAALVPASATAPEHCRVTGQILPEIRFEVSLPTAWSGRFYMTGNGGYAGEPLDSPQRARQRETAMRRGLAFAITDTGHDAAAEPLATFAVHSQKLLDYAFRSLHVTAVTAKRVIEAYYGAAPTRSYFEGCSTGGRQALILAQRFPEDFDGILAGAPVLNFTGTMVNYAACLQAMEANPIPYGKLAALASRIYQQCDGADGLTDGLIEDPRRCDFRPARDLPRCPEGGDAPDCFTQGQIATLERIYGDLYSQGRRIFPGWPVGAEITGPDGRSGWDNWIVRRDGGRPIWALFAETFFRYMAFPQKDPEYSLAKFDLEKDPARLEWIHSVLDATDTDLARFRERGGKLLMYFGWADPALNPRMGVEYYESVRERMGTSTLEFFRLFMIPGMFHCGGGVGTSTFDLLGPLVEWVEKGVPPDRILASRIVQGKTVRTRPLCPYPQVARYNGSGSIDEAANFTCRMP